MSAIVKPASQRKTIRSQRIIVLTYGFLGAVLLVAFLPSALRPPPVDSPERAEFSPDAPPEQTQQALASALNQAGSATVTSDQQGPGATDVATPEGAVSTDAPPPPPPAVFQPSKGTCVGSPARQVESLYSAPCAPAFQGDNGGATYAGVTRDLIKVAGIWCNVQFYPSYAPGAVPTTKPANEPGFPYPDPTWRVFQGYFNKRFEFYGRRLQLYVKNVQGAASGTGCSEQATTQAYQEAEAQFGPLFGVITDRLASTNAVAGNKKLSTGSYQLQTEVYRKHDPYVTSWYMEGTSLVLLNLEALCKQVKDRPAEFTDDPTITGKTRRIGLVIYRDPRNQIVDSAAYTERKFREMCGGEFVKTVTYNNNQDDPSGASGSGDAVVQMRAADVSTIVCLCEWFTPVVMTQAASKLGYYPEWWIAGSAEMDKNELARLSDPSQYRHAFGITPNEMPRPQPQTDWDRACKEIDSGVTCDYRIGQYIWDSLLQLSNGIQQAGPRLTPETFTRGLQTMPRRAPDPFWAVAGGYGPGDWTYSDYMALIWWDTSAVNPTYNQPGGAFRFALDGKRFKLGEIPGSEVKVNWFDGGPTSAPAG